MHLESGRTKSADDAVVAGLGVAKNCQLPSSSNQNEASGYLPLLKVVACPYISVLLVDDAHRRERCAAPVLFSESFGVSAVAALECLVS
jgi:hypothetical protein